MDEPIKSNQELIAKFREQQKNNLTHAQQARFAPPPKQVEQKKEQPRAQPAEVGIFDRIKNWLNNLYHRAEGQRHIKYTEVCAEYKIDNYTIIAVRELKIFSIENDTHAVRQSFVKWLAGPVDNKMVELIIERKRKLSKDYTENRKNGTGKITSAIVSRVKLDAENIDQQIAYLTKELGFNEKRPGYLRPNVAEIYPGIIETLIMLKEFKAAVPDLMKTFINLNEKLGNVQ